MVVVQEELVKDDAELLIVVRSASVIQGAGVLKLDYLSVIHNWRMRAML